MSATTDIRMINLQVQAEAAVRADKAAGTYDANVASDSKYYLWQSQFQTRPAGMEGSPEAYAQLLRQSLPEVTTIRIPFNDYSFNPDGSLDPLFERFLTAATAQGFEVTPNAAAGTASPTCLARTICSSVSRKSSLSISARARSTSRRRACAPSRSCSIMAWMPRMSSV